MDIEMISKTDRDFEVMDGNTENSTTATWTNESASLLQQAIKEQNLEDMKRLLNDGRLVNAPLQTTGPFAGFTALHVAIQYKRPKAVKFLIENYHADVHVEADDGVQPIHLLFFFPNYFNFNIILEAGADVNAEVSRDISLKYASDYVWCSDFGDKMPILIYNIESWNCIYYPVERFISKNANVEIKNPANKTLLMRIAENVSVIDDWVIEKFQDQGLINAHDNDGFLAIHYLLHPKKYGDFRYDGKQLYSYGHFIFWTVPDQLIKCGADIYATINGDPNTLLLNISVYRSCSFLLEKLLPHYDDITQSKALYFATLPLGDPETSFRIDPTRNEQGQWELLHQQRTICTELILKDLVNRRTFGLPVPDGEKELMDKLIASDPDIREIVHNYEKDFIQGKLKNRVVQYGDKRITHYDFISLSLNNKKLRLGVKNKTLINAFQDFPREDRDYRDYSFFRTQIMTKIDRASKRIELLDRLKKTEQLRKAVPLPYELILEIIEYLHNRDLENFIDAFIL